jgi:ferredoxin
VPKGKGAVSFLNVPFTTSFPGWSLGTRRRDQDTTMLANYGYSDGSGSYFITIDSARCNGCGDCVVACPAEVLQVVDEDPNDPFRDEPLVIVSRDKQKKVKYECGPCKPPSNRLPLPCVASCNNAAIAHSW